MDSILLQYLFASTSLLVLFFKFQAKHSNKRQIIKKIRKNKKNKCKSEKSKLYKNSTTSFILCHLVDITKQSSLSRHRQKFRNSILDSLFVLIHQYYYYHYHLIKMIDNYHKHLSLNQ